jgi:type II secretory pathway pseudopilin PulG
MKSTKCVACGFVGWSDVENCKACGAPLNQQPAHVLSTAPVYNTHYEQQEGEQKGLAIFGLVLGIISFLSFSLFIVGAIVGIVVSTRAMGRVKREPWQYGGRGLAIAGLVLSIVSLTSVIPILLIAAISIPNLMASYRAANEGSAIHSLRQIASAQAVYQSTTSKYANLEELAEKGLIDPKLGSGTKNGYKFTVELTTDEENVAGFAAVGVPETYRSSGIRSFYTDETSVIRAGDNHGGPSTKMDEPLATYADYPPRARGFENRPQPVY